MLKPVAEEVTLPGRYKLDEEVWRIGPLRVVKAHERDNDYLIKVFNSAVASKAIKERFFMDLDFYSKCRDTRLAAIVDVITQGDITYVIYNDPMGGNLEDLMIKKGDAFSESFVKNVASSMLDALAFLHLNEIAHGGCLPRNIFFPMNPALPGWLQFVQIGEVYCEMSLTKQLTDDLKDLAYLLCALMKRNIASFLREDFSPVVLKATKWAHLSPDFVDFIEQLWIADRSGRDAEMLLEHHWFVIIKPMALTAETEAAIEDDEPGEAYTSRQCWLEVKLNNTSTLARRRWVKAYGNVTASTVLLSGDEKGLTGPEGHAFPLAWSLTSVDVVVMLSKHQLTYALQNKTARTLLCWLRFATSADHDSFKSALTDTTDPEKSTRIVRKVELKSAKRPPKKDKPERKITRGKSYTGPLEETEQQRNKRLSAIIKAQSMYYSYKTKMRAKPKPLLAPFPSEIRTRIHPGHKWDRRAKELALVVATGVPLNHEVLDGDHWFIIDASWFKHWFLFVTSTRRMVPPGPIDNLWMISSKSNAPIAGLREDSNIDDGDYRRLPPQVWSFFEEWYGGGPAISFVGPPSHVVSRWSVHWDGIVGNAYDAESDDESENSEDAIVHIDAAKATPDELQKLAEITNF